MSQNNQSVPSTGDGAAGRGLATEPAPTIQIRKYGRGMKSKKFERRYMYLHIQPFDSDDLETGISKAVATLNTMLVAWRPPAIARFFRPDMWWEHVSCSFCKRRAEYEVEKWKAGVYAWRRGMCMRHWFVYHLSVITPDEPSELVSNQPISIIATSDRIMFSIETINYKYNIQIDKERAKMKVNYKGKLFEFTFRNHLNGYPLISSYMNILFDAYGTLEVFKTFLTDYVLKRRLYNNLVINDSIVLPPTPPATTNCDVCRWP
jgi:hypothetical protein